MTDPVQPSSAARPFSRAFLVVTAVAMLVLPVSPAIALMCGIAIALTLGNSLPLRATGLAQRTLPWSVVGLGAGMNLEVVARAGGQGLGLTIGSIGFALSLGVILGRRLEIDRDVSLLISVGTAVCGGSAIAAIAPLIRAREQDISIALCVVFLLNAVALLVYPMIGHRFGLTEDAFGLWCALAIHDTSSVVGAAAQYGQRALEVATSTKLARALWIVPLGLGIAAHRARKHLDEGATTAPFKRPWFIAGFLAVSALVTYVPALRGIGRGVALGARHLLTMTLFFVGLGFSREALRRVGVRPYLQATLLWVILGAVTLLAVRHG